MIKDITGQKFGNLTAIEIVGKYNKASVWLCRCSCGKETRVVLGNLMGGNTKSCGKCKND